MITTHTQNSPQSAGGRVYHVPNRAFGRLRLFRADDDFEAFRRVMIGVHQRRPSRILA